MLQEDAASASSNVRVAIRCRPMSAKEVARGCSSCATISSGGKVAIIPPVSIGDRRSNEPRTFTYDFAYGEESTQGQVYADLGHPIIVKAIEGYNSTIFAYGQVRYCWNESCIDKEGRKASAPYDNPPQLADRKWENLYHDGK
jgi:hypothetical protein